MVRTIPAIAGEMLPMTVPVSQAPAELVATPTTPTAMAPFPETPTRLSSQIAGDAGSTDATKQRPASGNTPTSISMASTAFDALLADSSKTPVNRAGGASANATAVETRDPSEPTDLQAVPTRVAFNAAGVGPGLDNDIKATIPITGLVPRLNRDSQPRSPAHMMNATLPMGGLKLSQSGSSLDGGYPNTLSRATGEQAVSSSGRAALSLQLQQFRERAFALTGITPRQPKRLAIAGGALAALVFVVLLLILLSSGGKPTDAGQSATSAAPPSTAAVDTAANPPEPTGDRPPDSNTGTAQATPTKSPTPPTVDAADGDPDPANPSTVKGPDPKKPKTPTPPVVRKPSGPAASPPKKKPKVF